MKPILLALAAALLADWVANHTAWDSKRTVPA